MKRPEPIQWNDVLERAGVPVTINFGEAGAELGDLQWGRAECVTAESGRWSGEYVYFTDHAALSRKKLWGVRADLVLAPRITPMRAEELRAQGIMHIDGRGNAYLSWPGFHVDIRGRESAREGAGRSPAREGTSNKRSESLFTPRRAQVAAFFLANPDAWRASIREVAEEARVSVGTAKATLELLTGAGYLWRAGDGYHVEDIANLLDAWAHAYPAGLGASTLLFRGDADLPRLLENTGPAWMSGEQAVPELVKGGSTAHIYVNGPEEVAPLIRGGRLRKAEAGNVVIRSAFWAGEKPDDATRPRLAPTPVIYADLLSVGDPRLTETAGLVKREIEALHHG